MDYSYINRITMLEVFSGTLTAVIPYLRIEKLFGFLVGELSVNAERTWSCIICGEDTAVCPTVFPCQHIGCYYCAYLGANKCPNCK